MVGGDLVERHAVVIARRSRPKDGVASLAYGRAIQYAAALLMEPQPL
jgi:hypothetical protein